MAVAWKDRDSEQEPYALWDCMRKIRSMAGVKFMAQGIPDATEGVIRLLAVRRGVLLGSVPRLTPDELLRAVNEASKSGKLGVSLASLAELVGPIEYAYDPSRKVARLSGLSWRHDSPQIRFADLYRVNGPFVGWGRNLVGQPVLEMGDDVWRPGQFGGNFKRARRLLVAPVRGTLVEIGFEDGVTIMDYLFVLEKMKDMRKMFWG